MHLSNESDTQIDARLLTVIALADFVSYDDAFGFVESPAVVSTTTGDARSHCGLTRAA